MACRWSSTTRPARTPPSPWARRWPSPASVPVVYPNQIVPVPPPVTSSIPAPAVNVFTSPYLEVSGFGTFTGVTSSSVINSVTVAITAYQSVSTMPANAYQLWNGTTAQIGTTATGTASTSSSNVDTATFTGVTYAELSALRLRIYANSGNTASGTAYVDAVGITVNYTPSPDATVTPSAVAVTSAQPAATVVTATGATVTMGSALAVTTSKPAPVVRQDAAASPAAVAVSTAQPAPAVVVLRVVQTAENIVNATSVTVTLGAATTAGNCLVAAVAVAAVTTNGSVSGVTLGGSAGNWAHLYDAGSGSTGGWLFFWADANCAAGQTSVLISTTGSSGTQTIAATVWEVSGLLPVTGSLLDQSTGIPSGASSASFSSGATSTTAQPQEAAFGLVAAAPGTAVTGPASPWVNSAGQASTEVSATAGYDLLAATAAVTYAGTFSPASAYGAAVITLKAAAGSGSTAAAPATLAVTTAVPAPAVRQDAAPGPAVQAVTTAAPAPAVSGSAAVTLGSALAVTSSLPAPVVRRDATAAPAALAASVAIAAPAVSATGNALVTLSSALSVSTAVPAPVVRQDRAISALVLTVTAAQPPPAAISGGLTAGVLAATSLVPAPAALSGSLTAGALAVTSAIQAPQVSGSSAGIITYNTGAVSPNPSPSTALTIPAGVLAGDVMLLIVNGFTNGTGPVLTVSSTGTAFTQIGATQAGGSGSGYTAYGGAYYAVATSADAGKIISASVSGGGSPFMCSVLAAYTGASTTAPVDVSGGANSASSPLTFPAKTTGAAGDWAVYLAAWGEAANGDYTGPSGTIREALESGGVGCGIWDSNGSAGGSGTGIGGGGETFASTAATVWLTGFTIGLAAGGAVNATAAPAAVTVSAAQPSPGVSGSLSAATLAVTAAQPAPAVSGNATASPAVLGVTAASRSRVPAGVCLRLS